MTSLAMLNYIFSFLVHFFPILFRITLVVLYVYLLKELENIIRVSGGAFYNIIRRFYILNTFCFV